MIIRIALTGGIAAGKSTVAAHLHELGAFLIDYDELAHSVVEVGSPGFTSIVDAFGTQCLNQYGELDRSRLADLVFGSKSLPGARERLNDIEHPLIYELAQRIENEALRPGRKQGPLIEKVSHSSVRQELGESSLMFVHDIPLLPEVYESIPFSFKHVVTVEAPVNVRVARMIATRGMSKEQALARIASQPSFSERKAIADTIIDSTQPLEQMFESLDILYRQWVSGQ